MLSFKQKYSERILYSQISVSINEFRLINCLRISKVAIVNGLMQLIMFAYFYKNGSCIGVASIKFKIILFKKLIEYLF